MQELGKQTNIEDDSSYSLDAVSSPRVRSCSPKARRSIHSPKNLESHSIAFDKSADVYGGYMLHKFGSPDKESRGIMSAMFTEAKTHQELTTPENRQRLISEHRQKQRSDNWRVGRLFTQSEGIYQMSTMWYRSYFALIILGILQGFTTWIISSIVGLCWAIQILVVDDTSISVVAQAMFVGILKIFFITLSVLVTWTFAPNAAGSGIPELRAILGGIHIKGYLSVKTLVVKIVGLGLALGSGLPLGLEGPFIHVSAILARQFTQIKLFAHLDRKQLLIAACAGGLSACFASPIGGVLFSIEVTLTYFEVTSYWTTFCCAAVASCMTSILQPENLIPFETSFDSDSWSKSEIPLFIVVGLCGGLFGCAFTRFHEIVVYLRRRYQKKTFGSNPFAISAFVATMFTIVSFSVQVTRHPARNAIPDLFDNDTPSLRTEDSTWNSGVGMYGNLILFIVINFIFTGLTITLNIPCGVFAPTFTIGAALGRLMGEFFQDTTSPDAFFDVNNPAVYAVVGAAAFTSGVTKTISPAVIAMELTHDAQLAMPILLAVTVACGVCSQLYYSFYDSTLQLKNIPLLPFSPSEPMNKSYSPPRPYEAIDVMEAEFQYLSTTPSQAQVIKLLEMSDHDWYPIVHSNRDMVLVGEVARDTLVDFMSSFNELELNAPASNPPQINKPENAEQEKSIMSTRFMNQLNLSPIQVVAEMSLIKVYTLFHVLKPENIYVTKYARLIGVIHENDLLTRELGIQLKKRHFLHRLWNFLHSLICKYRRVAV